jgi:hypothetical protein
VPRLRLALLLVLLAAVPAAAQQVAASGGSFGGAGLIEMPNARARPDGTLEFGSTIRRDRRFWHLHFQALPFLDATFRVAERLDGFTGTRTTTDRAFDIRLRLIEEGDWTPAVAIGLRDLVGTGIYGGEYIVASRRFGDVDVTLGMGWGRLGTGRDFANPLASLAPGFFDERPREVGGGGLLSPGFFRGPDAAIFGGLEWTLPPLASPWGVMDGFRAKVEWSGDALRDERFGYPVVPLPERGRARSRLNAGLQWSNGWLDAGAYVVNGSDALVRLTLRIDAERPPDAARPPPPLAPAAPAGLDPAARTGLVFAALREAGFQPVAFGLSGVEARIAVAGGPARGLAQAAGRALRAVHHLLPEDAAVLVLSWWQGGIEIGRLMVPRAMLEAALVGRASVEEAWLATHLLPADGMLWPDAVRAPLPRVTTGIAPRIALLLGDPTRTLRWQVGVAAGARIDVGGGFAVAGSVAQTIAGNLAGGPPSDSLLPRVRSDWAEYARDGRNAAIPALYAEWTRTLAPDWHARATAGLLEPMFGGLSAEVLWRPQDGPLAIGADIAAVRQRETNQRFGFRDYGVVTGHLSLYADLPWWNLYGVVRAGRYLAGDWGATVELGRRFSSGIEVGAFATLTNVPFARFGEGSFDKGIYIRIPLDLFGGDPAQRGGLLIRPVQRDGGQRLSVDAPLWETTREGRATALREGFRGFGR